ncbi:MAG: T9SS type A sorting domain-containing protein [Paludibacteraceae bacterium]|nr:T9SS type A sorting domain-containing protein [Paludibacteraceae bacterium]
MGTINRILGSLIVMAAHLFPTKIYAQIYDHPAEKPNNQIETSALQVSMPEKKVRPCIYNDGEMLYVGNCGGNADFNIYDIAGKVVTHTTTAPIEISNLERGVYVLEINGKGYKFFV